LHWYFALQRKPIEVASSYAIDRLLVLLKLLKPNAENLRHLLLSDPDLKAPCA
jgi:hypothetical protein